MTDNYAEFIETAKKNLAVVSFFHDEIACNGNHSCVPLYDLGKQGYIHDPRVTGCKGICHHGWIHACGKLPKAYHDKCDLCNRWFSPLEYLFGDGICGECL